MAWFRPSTFLSHLRQPRSLRTLFLGLFIAQIVPALSLIIWLSNESKQKTIEDLVHVITTETSANARILINDELESAIRVNQINQDFERLRGNQTSNDDLLKQLLIQLKNFPNLAAVGVHYTRGYTIRLNRFSTPPSEYQLEVISPESPNQLQISRINSVGQKLVDLATIKPFTINDWPWYRSIQNIQPNSWSLPYITRNGYSLVLSTYTSLKNPQTQTIEALFVSTLSFQRINQLLEQQKLQAHSILLITELDGSLIGTSTPENPYFFSPPGPGSRYQFQRRKLQDSEHPVIAALSPHLTQAKTLNPGESTTFTFDLNQKRYFAKFERLNFDQSLPWLLVTVVSEQDFDQAQRENLYLTLLICALLIVVLSAINLAIAQAIIHPIQALQKNTKTLTPAPASERIIPVKEIQDLDTAFRDMTASIQQTLNQLQTSNLALSEQRAHLAQILDVLPVGVCIHDKNGTLTYINPTGLELLGLETPPDFQDRYHLNQDFRLYQANTDILYPPEKLPALQALQGHTAEIDDIEVHLGQDRRALKVRSTPIYDQAQEIEAALVAFVDITDRKQVEQILENYNATLSQEVAQRTAALQKSEERFRFALQSTDTSWWDWDVKTNDVAWSENFDQMVGRAPNSYPKNAASFLSFLHPDDVEPTRAKLFDSIENGTPYKTEFRFVHPDGSIRWIMATGTVQRDETGQAVRMSGINLDITERKQIEEALRISEQRLRMAMESTSTNWWEWDLVANQLDWSDKAMGALPEHAEKTQDTFYSLLHPDDRERVKAGVELSLATGKPYEGEFRLAQADGSYVWMFGTGNVEFNEAGQPIRISGLNININAMKEVQLALAEQKQLLQALFDQASQFSALLTPTGQVVQINQRALDFAGVTEADVLNQHFWATPWWQSSEAMQQQLKAAIQRASHGEIVRYDTENCGGNGERIILDFSIRPIFNNEQHIIFLLCEGRDITDKFRMQQALQESEQRFRQSFQTTAVSSALISLDGKFIEVNPALCEFLGYTASELENLYIEAVSDPNSVPFSEDLTQQLLHRQITAYTQERRYQHRDGHWLWGLLNVSLVRDEQQHPQYYVCQIQNISPLKQAQEKLEQVNTELERLTQIDGLTGVYNRRYFDQALEREWHIAFRENESLALLMLDIDYFKLYNDTLGHQAGDYCLQQVAAVLGQAIHRPSDLVARYGGEEFSLILPRTDVSGAMIIAQRIHALIQAKGIPHPASEIAHHITVSIGIHAAIPRPGLHLHTWIKNADDALYQAKQQGRNRSIVLEEILNAPTKVEPM